MHSLEIWMHGEKCSGETRCFQQNWEGINAPKQWNMQRAQYNQSFIYRCCEATFTGSKVEGKIPLQWEVQPGPTGECLWESLTGWRKKHQSECEDNREGNRRATFAVIFCYGSSEEQLLLENLPAVLRQCRHIRHSATRKENASESKAPKLKPMTINPSMHAFVSVCMYTDTMRCILHLQWWSQSHVKLLQVAIPQFLTLWHGPKKHWSDSLN